MAFVRRFSISSRSLLLALALLASGCVRRYPLQGLVLSSDPSRSTVTISHRAIPGVMPAMAMPIRLARPAEGEGLEPGAVVAFELALSRQGAVAHRLRRLPPSNQVEEDGQVVKLQPPASQVAVGDLAPDFTLTDQDGQPVRLSDFRGRVTVVNFLYTRCPLPEVCPRLAATFARIQRRFADRQDLALLTITLDPHHDTPDVLKKYSMLWRAVPERWRFLTGTAGQIREAVEPFGIVYWPEEGIVTHTSTVGVVGRDGRLRARVDGLSFDAKQLGDLVETALSY